VPGGQKGKISDVLRERERRANRGKGEIKNPSNGGLQTPSRCITEKAQIRRIRFGRTAGLWGAKKKSGKKQLKGGEPFKKSRVWVQS